MDLVTIFSSLNRNRLGALLITIQVSLTLVIVLNAAGVVREHVERMRSVSGVDEANVFSLTNRWIGQPTDSPARVARDLAVLRATPGVTDAVSTNGVPLSDRGWGTKVDTKPIDRAKSINLYGAQLYYLDDHGANALGIRLTSGRWFTAEDVDRVGNAGVQPLAIITRALAGRLFPNGNALGNNLYTQGDQPSMIIGIVENLQSSSPGNPGTDVVTTQSSVIMPQRMALPVLNNYVIRVRPGLVATVMKDVERRLRAEEPLRVITEFRTFSETRLNIYRSNRTLTTILVSVSVLLLVVTGLGIVGLTSFWVAQRRRHIGVRRALGARRSDILKFFLTENFVVVAAGTVLGLAIAISLNLWLTRKLGMPRIDTTYIIVGALTTLVLGQFAALWPALRAASVPPALATRSA
jgi:putative ABC transport system permease protein